MALLQAYALAEGHDNVAGLISLREMIGGSPLDSHATSLGTFRASREFIGLDQIAQDDGDDTWEWRFVSLLPSDIEEIETEILGGARSGEVTVETKNRYGAWVQLNAVLTLPQLLPLQGIKFGGVTLTFVGGVLIP